MQYIVCRFILQHLYIYISLQHGAHGAYSESSCQLDLFLYNYEASSSNCASDLFLENVTITSDVVSLAASNAATDDSAGSCLTFFKIGFDTNLNRTNPITLDYSTMDQEVSSET